MDFTNINDPAGVKALLESLRSSQVWSQAVTTEPDAAHPPRSASQIPPPAQDANSSTASTSKPSVAELLSQLRNSGSRWTETGKPPLPPLPASTSSSSSALSSSSYRLPEPENPAEPFLAPEYHEARPPHRRQDVREMTFQQSLPHLAQLAEDSTFVEAVRKIKREQDALESQLWEERAAIRKKHEEKVKFAQTKANMIGVGMSKHDAEMLSASFREEVRKFDLQRALPAWDGLVAKHQTALEVLAVPTMFRTTDKVDLEKQKRIMQVLEGLVS
ncbi:hypothetical protein FA95DRAFT_1604569 [Auriscalpium vulgare]|uniref:Uncharacterized protein n=1 Tax=Auriscalpium vulgare TaxID=40419 RepID=A0ACB8RZ63_9AGAM|nr:hypothetical protein FA95DRAFT_1604569 [Auriscalpium vulgare]